MKRSTSRHRHRSVRAAVSVALAGWLMAAYGCQGDGARWFVPQKSGPPAPAKNISRDLPPFVYPEQPPLVDRQVLNRLLTQLGGERTLLWVMGPIDAKAAATTSALAGAKADFRQSGVELVGLYSGPPKRWVSDVRPMLRKSRANFVCAVVNPPARSSVAYWLTGRAERSPPGLYLVDRSHRVLTRLSDQPDEIRTAVANLSQGSTALFSGVPATQETLRARVRVISLGTGQVIARATADGPDTAHLARQLAGQLATGQPPGQIAVLPLRRLRAFGSDSPGGLADIDSASAGRLDTLADQLTTELGRRGWPLPVGPDITVAKLRQLGLKPIDVEFDPARLQPLVAWAGIVVGTLERHTAPVKTAPSTAPAQTRDPPSGAP